MQSLRQPPGSLADGVIRTATFNTRPPSPPYIQIPAPLSQDNFRPLTITPSYDSVDPSLLTSDDLKIITGGKSQQATDSYRNMWRYEDRRKAQPILDFLYLGPFSAVRDTEFLHEEGITMLLAVRDASMAHLRLVAVEKAAAELNLQVDFLDVAGRQELIQAFPRAIAKVNDHLLRVYKSQLQAVNHNPDRAAAGNLAIDTSTFRRGKVLMFCETGNERSAIVAAAYLMAMYGTDMISTVQFVNAQRFCATFDEDTKYLLQSFGDILKAKRMVAKEPRPPRRAVPSDDGTINMVLDGSPRAPPASKKRGFLDTMDDKDLKGADYMDRLDAGRYYGRPAFAPYRQDENETHTT